MPGTTATMPATNDAGLEPLGGLLKFAAWTIHPLAAFGVVAVLACVATFAVAPELVTDETLYPDDPTGEALLFAFGGSILGFYLSFFVSIIPVARFTYRAMRNLHQLDAPDAQMSPGWAVGWYFVPIANLFKPVEGMRQIVDASYRQAGKTAVDTPSLALWWGTWIAGSVVGNVADRIPDETALIASALSIGLLTASALRLLEHLRDIERLQDGVIAAQAF